MYSVQQVPLDRRALFSDLTFPLFRPLLKGDEANSRLVVLGAALLGRPVGLAIAEIDEQDFTQAEVHSIAVSREHRHQGLGAALLFQLENALSDRGVGLTRLTYMSGTSSTPAVEAMLRRSGWLAARPRMMICGTDMPTIMQAPWMQMRSLPAAFSLFPWRELVAAERADILDRQRRESWFPDLLSPFRNEHLIEPMASLGLRYKGEIAGWCIAHVLTEDMVRYSSLFVRREHQMMGRAVPLLASSIAALHGSPVYRARFDVAMDNPTMLRFVKGRMAPYLQEIRYIMRSYKQIGVWAEAEKRPA